MLVFSHITALGGANHLEFLLNHKLLQPSPSSALDELYARGILNSTRETSRAAPTPSLDEIRNVSRTVEEKTANDTEEVMVLQRWNGKLMAEHLQLPEVEVEIERAVEQVEKSIKAKKELGRGKSPIDESKKKT